MRRDVLFTLNTYLHNNGQVSFGNFLAYIAELAHRDQLSTAQLFSRGKEWQAAAQGIVDLWHDSPDSHPKEVRASRMSSTPTTPARKDGSEMAHTMGVDKARRDSWISRYPTLHSGCKMVARQLFTFSRISMAHPRSSATSISLPEELSKCSADLGTDAAQPLTIVSQIAIIQEAISIY